MLRFLLEKEFKQIFRDSFMPRLLVAFPLMLIAMLPWAADMEIKHISMTIIDNAHDKYSKELSNKFRFSDYLDVQSQSSSYDMAMELVEFGEVDMIVEIPTNFGRDIEMKKSPEVLVSVNSVDGTKAGLGSSYARQIIGDFKRDCVSALGYDGGNVSIPVSYRFNKKMDYKYFMLPAMMSVLLFLLCGFLPALNIVTEKESGTIEQINVTPISRFQFILAKLIPYWIIGLSVMAVGFVLIGLLYGLYPAGSYVTMLVFSMLFSLAISGFGLVISNYSDTIQQSMYLMLFFVIVMILMSGLFTPMSSMPMWAQVVTYLNPVTHFNIVLRAVYLKGASFAELMNEFYILLGFTAGFNLWAVLSYKKRG